MIGHDEMRVVADEKPSLDIDVELFELIDFIHQRDGIDDDAVADDTRNVRMKDAGWDQMKNVLVAADDDGVPGIGTSLVTGNDIDVFTQKVDNLSFAFVAPLGSNDNLYGHSFDSIKKTPMRNVLSSEYMVILGKMYY